MPLVLVLALPAYVGATDIPVSYLVEQKPLKDAVAGTSLTFELFTDTACSAPAAHAAAIEVDAISVITKLVRVIPKGADKSPNVAELRATLPTVTVPGNLWLKVSGAGIVPSGGVCQAQSGHVAPVAFDGALSTKDVVLLWGAHLGGQWGFETPTTVGLPATSMPIAVERAAAVALQGLDTSTRQACRIELVTPVAPYNVNNVVISDANSPPDLYYVPIFGLSGCMPACSDGVRNGKESDVDCGGDTECARCPASSHCSIPSDCASGQCILCPLCTVPLCQ
jgi:hypothetical protein